MFILYNYHYIVSYAEKELLTYNIIIVMFYWNGTRIQSKFITETITDYLEESHFHYQSHSISNDKNHTALKNN